PQTSAYPADVPARELPSVPTRRPSDLDRGRGRLGGAAGDARRCRGGGAAAPAGTARSVQPGAAGLGGVAAVRPSARDGPDRRRRSEEHTSELQSHLNLVCRLLLEPEKT